MGFSHPLTNHNEICTQVWCGVKAENLLSKIFIPPKKIWQEKPQIYVVFSRTTINWRHIIQHIDKRITDISCTINALKDGTQLGA